LRSLAKSADGLRVGLLNQSVWFAQPGAVDVLPCWQLYFMKNFLISVAVLALFCGCFTAEQPFYEESDITTDDRLVGSYDGGKPYH
jgi:hypothetical protein